MSCQGCGRNDGHPKYCPNYVDPWYESEEFYNLMQVYCHTPIYNQKQVVKAFEDVKQYIAQHIHKY
jgi:predicted metal-binding protein